MTFRVGMKVVCVDAGHHPLGIVGDPELTKGAIYTVRHLDLGPLTGKPILYVDGGTIGWFASRFRPAVSPKAEVSFTTGADPDSEQYDNRRRIPVSEWGCSA